MRTRTPSSPLSVPASDARTEPAVGVEIPIEVNGDRRRETGLAAPVASVPGRVIAPDTPAGWISVPDGDLMRLIANGNAPAFDVIFSRYRRIAVTLATRVCGPGLAEEAVQDAFLQISRAAATFQPELGSFRNWMLSIVSSRAIDAFRRNSRHATRRADAEELDQLVATDEVEATVLRRDQARTVRSMLNTIPAEQSRIIAMAYFEQLTHIEIAQRTGLPVGTVKGRIRLGLAKLRRTLGTHSLLSPGI